MVTFNLIMLSTYSVVEQSTTSVRSIVHSIPVAKDSVLRNGPYQINDEYVSEMN